MELNTNYNVVKNIIIKKMKDEKDLHLFYEEFYKLTRCGYPPAYKKDNIYTPLFELACSNKEYEYAEHIFSTVPVFYEDALYDASRENDKRIVEWLFSKFLIDSKYDLTQKKYCITNIISNAGLIGNFEMFKWGVDQVIDKNLDIIDIFRLLIVLINGIVENKNPMDLNVFIITEENQLEMAKYLHKHGFLTEEILDKLSGSKNLLYHIEFNKTYKFAKWLSEIYPAYEYKIKENGDIEHILKTKEYKMVENSEYNVKEKCETCLVCMEDKEKYVKLECGHKFCKECTLKSIENDNFKKCNMCLKMIEIGKILFIDNKI